VLCISQRHVLAVAFVNPDLHNPTKGRLQPALHILSFVTVSRLLVKRCCKSSHSSKASAA
jgi:hypothetical protein